VGQSGGVSRNEKRKQKNFVPTCTAICGTTPVDVKNNPGSNTKHFQLKPKLAGEKTEKTGTKP
jgi:hypothetical protein